MKTSTASQCEDLNPERRLAVNNHAACSVIKITGETEAFYLRNLHSGGDVGSVCERMSGEEFQRWEGTQLA